MLFKSQLCFLRARLWGSHHSPQQGTTLTRGHAPPSPLEFRNHPLPSAAGCRPVSSGSRVCLTTGRSSGTAQSSFPIPTRLHGTSRLARSKQLTVGARLGDGVQRVLAWPRGTSPKHAVTHCAVTTRSTRKRFDGDHFLSSHLKVACCHSVWIFNLANCQKN